MKIWWSFTAECLEKSEPRKCRRNGRNEHFLRVAKLPHPLHTALDKSENYCPHRKTIGGGGGQSSGALSTDVVIVSDGDRDADAENRVIKRFGH